MDKHGNESSIYDVLHFRKLRDLVRELCAKEGMNIENYDVFHMIAYRDVGSCFQGKNFCTIGPARTGFSCFEPNQVYDFIEIPLKSNSSEIPSIGNFLLLARKTDGEKYIFGNLSVQLNKKRTLELKKVVQKIEFTPMGSFESFINSDGKVSITKRTEASKITFSGITDFQNFYFDSEDHRIKAYKTNRRELFEMISGNKTKNLIDSRKVKVYKKKKNDKKN